MISPKTFLDTLENQQISVRTFLQIREASLGLNPHMAVIEAIKQEANTLDELWLGNVPKEYYMVIFSSQYSLAAGAVELAISPRPLEQSLQNLYSVLGLEVDPVKQAGMHLFQDRVVSLLAEDTTGFSVVDYLAYSDQETVKRLKKPHGQLIQRIVGIGAERYKKLYCEVAGIPYTPRAK